MNSYYQIASKTPSYFQGALYQIDFDKSFPAGEFSFKLDPHFIDKLKNLKDSEKKEVIIIYNYSGDSSFFRLGFIVDAIRQIEPDIDIVLEIPYIPGLRQDRVCREGESFASQIYCTFLDSLGLSLIETLDPHNEEMLKRFLKNTPYSLMSSRFLVAKTRTFLATIGCDPSQAIVVSPDKGAVQRALHFNKNIRTDETPIVVFDKKRDPVTGAVVSIEPLENGYLVKDAVVIVRDDIISGGGTFVAIAKELKKLEAKKIILALSFNEGICKKELLQSAGVDAIISQMNIKEPENNDQYFI